MTKFVKESWLVLLMGIVFATMLAGAQNSLSDRIRENQIQALNAAIAEVVPNTAATEQMEIGGRSVYKCLDADGAHVGWAIDASGPGFVDRIRVVAGLDAEAQKIIGVRVIENVETPGLGNKIQDPEWVGQYDALDATREISVQKRPPVAGANEIQAITGATWSSVYVTDIVNAIINEIRPELGRR